MHMEIMYSKGLSFLWPWTTVVFRLCSSCFYFSIRNGYIAATVNVVHHLAVQLLRGMWLSLLWCVQVYPDKEAKMEPTCKQPADGSAIVICCGQ